MLFTECTTEEKFKQFLQDTFHIKTNKVRLIKMSDDTTILFQIISPNSFSMDMIMRMGIVLHNPNFLADEGLLKITFLVNK